MAKTPDITQVPSTPPLCYTPVPREVAASSRRVPEAPAPEERVQRRSSIADIDACRLYTPSGAARRIEEVPDTGEGVEMVAGTMVGVGIGHDHHLSSVDSIISTYTSGNDTMRSMLAAKIGELRRLEWPEDTLRTMLLRFTSAVPKPSIDILFDCLDLIHNYKLTPTASVEVESTGVTAAVDPGAHSTIVTQQIVLVQPVVEWERLLRTVAINSAFSFSSPKKDIDTVIRELKEANPSQDRAIGLVLSQFHNVQGYSKSLTLPTGIRIERNIDIWEADDIARWAADIKRFDADRARNVVFIPEMLAVAARATKLVYGYEPHITQIISALLIIERNPSIKGKLAQIYTGEGKTLTVAMVATVKALQRHKVDIVTTSEVLAARDAEKSRKFYELFGLSVSHNTGELTYSGSKACYQKDIVYGTPLYFQGDILRHEYHHLDTRVSRGFEVVIVDEVDSMFIDQHASSTFLSSPKPGADRFTPLLGAMWKALCTLKAAGRIKSEKQVMVTEESGEETLTDLQDCLVARGRVLIEHEDGDVGIVLPKYLKDFALKQLPKWAQSVILAEYRYEENRHYVVKNHNIALLDCSNTGVLQERMELTDGLHQCLQMKHGLPVTPQRFITNYLSNIGFLRRYQQIFGLTGTLGSVGDQGLLSEVYSVDCVLVPPHKPRQLLVLPGVIASSRKQWLDAIVNTVVKEASNDRAVLVICESIKKVDEINEVLVKKYPAYKVSKYTRSDSIFEKEAMEETIPAGRVILATNLAGRGTDLALSPVVERAGGMHVCLTFFPDNLRVQAQAFGRAARQGKAGTAQLVLDYYSTLEKFGFSKSEVDQMLRFSHAVDAYRVMAQEPGATSKPRIPTSISAFEALRETVEARVMDSIKQAVRRIGLQDELFNEFCTLVNHDLRQPVFATQEYGSYRLTGTRVPLTLVFNPLDDITQQEVEERWAIWLQHATKTDPDKAREEFKEFKAGISRDYARDILIVNPISYNLRALLAINKGQYERAQSFCDRAIALDPRSFIPHLNKAWAEVMLAKDGYVARAREHLISAKDLLDAEIGMIVGLSVFMTQNPKDCAARDQLITVCDNLKQIIDSNIKAIDEPGLRGLAQGVIEIDKIFTKKEFAPHIAELKAKGVHSIVQFGERTAWRNIVGVALIGVVQIAIGAAVLAFTGPLMAPFMTSLMAEGISDIVTSITAGISGKFDWKQYRVDKAYSIALSFAMAGLVSYSHMQALKSVEGAARKTLGSALKNPLNTVRGWSSAALGTGRMVVPLARGLEVHAMATPDPDDAAPERARQKYAEWLKEQQRKVSAKVLSDLRKSGKLDQIKEAAENQDAIEESIASLEKAVKAHLNAWLQKKVLDNVHIRKIATDDGKAGALGKEIEAIATKYQAEINQVIEEDIAKEHSVLTIAQKIASNPNAYNPKIEAIADKIFNELDSRLATVASGVTVVEGAFSAKIRDVSQKAILSIKPVKRDSEGNYVPPSLSVEEHEAIQQFIQHVTKGLMDAEVIDADGVYCIVDAKSVERLNDAVIRIVQAYDAPSSGDPSSAVLKEQVVEFIRTDIAAYDAKLRKANAAVQQHFMASVVHEAIEPIYGKSAELCDARGLAVVYSNAFTRRSDRGYQYEAQDISFIQDELMRTYSALFRVHQPIGDADAIGDTLAELMGSLGDARPVLCTYNIHNLHWVAFAALRTDGRTTVLYKDSVGLEGSDAAEAFRQRISAIDEDALVLVHSGQEQVMGFECGIFALSNMQIMAAELQRDRIGFVERFPGFEGFCTLDQAIQLRTHGFARRYVLSAAEHSSQESIRSQKLAQIQSHHYQDVVELSRRLSVTDIGTRYIVEALRADQSFDRNMPGKVVVELRNDELMPDDDYSYHYAVLWSNNIGAAISEEIITALGLPHGSYTYDADARVLNIMPDRAGLMRAKLKLAPVVVVVDREALFDNLGVHARDEQAVVASILDGKEEGERMVEEGRATIERRAEVGASMSIARKMLARGRPIAEIAEDTGLSVAEVESLRDVA